MEGKTMSYPQVPPDMGDMNLVFVKAQVSSTPRLNRTEKGVPVCNFYIERKGKDPMAAKVVAWGIWAEESEKLYVGDVIAIHGALSEERWTSKPSSREHRRTVLTIKNFILLDAVDTEEGYNEDIGVIQATTTRIPENVKKK